MVKKSLLVDIRPPGSELEPTAIEAQGDGSPGFCCCGIGMPSLMTVSRELFAAPCYGAAYGATFFAFSGAGLAFCAFTNAHLFL
jgi:hypothetical protein